MFVVTAFLQGTLLLMAMYFEYWGPEKMEVDVHGSDVATNGSVEEQEGQPAEDTPLLQRL